ncbi:hypothetical protein RMCBS344292_15785 [Rhizopus microsporus]|nr:hypothetical protein RMCBS344292_15785 [Rhizopus microsporus]
MGGIVGAETILKFVESPHDLLGASIIGMLAYDTPFYSIHHGLVTDQAKYGIEKFQKVGQFCSLGASALMSTTATRAIESSKRTGSTKSWGLLAGAVGAVAVGAAAYMARDKISATLVDAYDEFTFIKDLTDMHGCDERVKKLLQLPAKEDTDEEPKTFIRLPPDEDSYAFIPFLSSAPNVIKAHTSMFDSSEGSDYYQLGKDSVTLITDMVARFLRKH